MTDGVLQQACLHSWLHVTLPSQRLDPARKTCNKACSKDLTDRKKGMLPETVVYHDLPSDPLATWSYTSDHGLLMMQA